MKYLNRLILELKKINLPKDKFAIYGGGVLSVHGIRECEDLDIIVKNDLWQELIGKFKNCFNGESIEIGNLSFWDNFLPLEDSCDKLIERADVIDGIRYVKLNDIIKWKKAKLRDKDVKDI